MPRATSLKDALRFFLPLIYMTELNMISKSAINAFMARLPNPKIGLCGVTLMWDDPNGAVFGVVAWGAAFKAETLILG